ncbi:MAG: hypothetical protein WBW88_16760, partial [Rhodothermales bacterium]
MIIAFGLTTSGVLAQVPDSIAFQAYLTADDGTPMNDDDITLTFRLYDAAENGQELWVETQAGIGVADGVFSVYLGRLESLGGVGFETPAWLSIARGDAGATELEPRIPLVATPYSYRARWLGDDAIIAGDNVSIARDGNALVVSGAAGWALGGNAGTVPGSDFIGTTDTSSVEIRVNNRRGLRIEGCRSSLCEPEDDDVNVVAGAASNSVDIETRSASIGGGANNRIVDNFGSVIGGGANNRIVDSGGSVIGGGDDNEVLSNWGTIGGGHGNRLQDFSNYPTIAGGANNQAGGHAAFVGGGSGNVATGFTSSVVGGTDNMAIGNFGMVVGGRFSVARAPYTFASGYNARANHE